MRDGDYSATTEAMHGGRWWRVVPPRQHHRTHPPAGGVDDQQQIGLGRTAWSRDTCGTAMIAAGMSAGRRV
jgi:hypothetical protein